MRIRLIGLGDVGESLVFDACRYFHDKGLNAFLERRLVIKATTNRFVQAFAELQLKLTQSAPSLVVGTSLVSLQRALACLFFGGRDADLSLRWQAIVEGKRIAGAEEEHLSASRYFGRLYRDLKESERTEFLSAIRTHFEHHVKDVTKPLVPNLEPDWLIVPTMPMTTQLNNTLPLIGRVLATSIPELDFRRGRIVQGLGLAGSQVDAVAIVFSLNDTFAAEGARLIGTAIRRALQPREANRILAVLGFGVYDTPNEKYPAGRYLAEHFRLSKGSAAFDGLLTSPNTDNLKKNFPPVMASIAVSSTPDSIQIDNPDANQVQRDFGRGLVGFGYSEGDTTALSLYGEAIEDWKSRHAEPNGEKRDDLNATIQRQVTLLKPAGLATPTWVTAMLADPGKVEFLTARKVIVFIGHDDRLSANDLQTLRTQLEKDFPRARSVIYKYELPPPVDRSSDNAGVMTWVRERFGRGRQKTPPEVLRRPQHIALFVVDALQTRVLRCFADYLRWSVGTVSNGHTIPPGTDDDWAVNRKLTTLIRGMLDYPNDDPNWPVPDGNSVPHLRSLLSPSVLGGVDPAAVAAGTAEAAKWIAGEQMLGTGELERQAMEIENTVGQAAQAFILDPKQVADGLLDAGWVADSIEGLNVICNEEMARRQVAILIADFVNQVQTAGVSAGNTSAFTLS